MILDLIKHLILCGEFNYPDIDWDTLTVTYDLKVQDRNIQELIDLSIRFDLIQKHDQRTRNENFRNLVLPQIHH